MKALEATSMTWKPGKGTDTSLNCSCTSSSFSVNANVELDYLPLKKTLCKFVVRFRSSLRTIGPTWRPGEGTDTRLWHCCERTEVASDAIHGCKLHPSSWRIKLSSAVTCKLSHDHFMHHPRLSLNMMAFSIGLFLVEYVIPILSGRYLADCWNYGI